MIVRRIPYFLGLAALLLRATPLAAHPAMSPAEMQQMLHAWYASHQESRQAVIPADAVIDTIFVGAYNVPQFDADHDPNTVVDTLTIYQGEVVLWKWSWGAHTTTSGSAADPVAGTIWDHSITSTNPEFEHTFGDVGDFPFFCAVDQGEMRGLIRVVAAVSSLPSSKHLGFESNPFPNPTAGGMSFRIGLREAGHAMAAVFDTRGRLVATLLDGFAPAGSQLVTWNGNSGNGAHAKPGVYFVSLRLPGFSGRRSFVLDR